jgi:hypothetical protein
MCVVMNSTSRDAFSALRSASHFSQSALSNSSYAASTKMARWSHSQTLGLLDKHGNTLVTGGPQRQAGYEKLCQHLNAQCTPPQLPTYAVTEINDYCHYLCRNFSAFVAPNLKGLFSNGKKYFPAGFVEGKEVKDSTEENSALPSPSPIPTNASSESSILQPSRSPSRSLRVRPKDAHRSRSKPRIRKKQKLTTKDEPSLPNPHIVIYHEQLAPPVEWQEFFNLRSKKHRVPFQDIAPGMVRLE